MEDTVKYLGKNDYSIEFSFKGSIARIDIEEVEEHLADTYEDSDLSNFSKTKIEQEILAIIKHGPSTVVVLGMDYRELKRREEERINND